MNCNTATLQHCNTVKLNIMKKLVILFSLALVSAFSFAQAKSKPAKAKTNQDKYHDNIDDRMKGPKGEVIYIGANGGRYYLRNDKKIYLPAKKKKA